MKSLVRAFFRFTLLPIVRSMYRLQVSDAMNVPANGGVLMISNHVSYIDAFILYAACPRPVQFVIVDRFMESKAIAWFLRLFGAIPIDKERSRQAIKITAAAINEGGVVCIFPEGQLTRTGVMNELQKGFSLIARQAKCPVVPVYMDGLWGSIYSFERGRYFKKWPRKLPYPVSVAFGEPAEWKEATVDWAYQALLDASAVAFDGRKERQFSEPLEIALVRALKKNAGKILFSEHGKTVRKYKRNQVLATAISLSRRWKRIPLDTEEDRIAVLLPSGPAPAIINLALVLSGKTPVNVPFEVINDDLAVAGFSRTLNELGVRTIITSKLFVPRLVDVWEADEGRFIDMMREIRAAGVVRIFFERIRAFIEPTFVTKWRLDLDDHSRDAELDEAIGLVPDVDRPAIFLTGSEVQKNTAQTMGTHFLQWDDTIFSDLPLNSAEGTHLSLWAPLLSGKAKVISRSLSKKLDPALIEEIAIEENADVIAINQDGVDEIEALEKDWSGGAGAITRNVLIFGREISEASVGKIEQKTQLNVCRAWASKITGQVISLSFPHPDNVPENTPGPIEEQFGFRPHSVGRLLPGITARIDRHYANLYIRGELSLRAPIAITRKVMEARAARGESTAPIPKGPFTSITDPKDESHLVKGCWIVAANQARFDQDNFLFLDEDA